ncbi:MAG TPA: FtsX-like permease family protein, partial [Xanthomonadaceae bacterium]|nr:FtsX-like permease family protein [Xanthomonadaceae bacterium]
LYGLLSWQVRVRSREIGIRLALGADAASVRRSVIAGGLRLVAFGLPFGLLAAILAGRGLEGMLFGVSAHDPATLLAVAVGFLALGIVATWVPAWRSSRVDPMRSLRDE